MTDIMAGFLGDTQTPIDQYNLLLDSIIGDPEKLIKEIQELMGITIRVASFLNQSFNTTSLEQALLGFDIGFDIGLDTGFDTGSNTQQNVSSAPRLQQTLIAGASNAFNNARTLQQFTTDYQKIALITTTRQTQQNNAKAIEIAVRETATIIESELHLGDEGGTLFTSRELAQLNLKILLKQMQARKNQSPDIADPIAVPIAGPIAGPIAAPIAGPIAATISELMAATATASSAKYGIIADQKTISIDTDTNSLVLSYRLYNNFNREAEIRSRNKLTDTFIKKGTILKVSEQ